MYAVIALAGKQFKVSAGDTLTVDRLSQEEGSTFSVQEVLLLSDGDNVQIGTPHVKKASVTLKVVTHDRADKIRVAKYKSKSRYRRVHGHRQHQTQVEVVSISA